MNEEKSSKVQFSHIWQILNFNNFYNDANSSPKILYSDNFPQNGDFKFSLRLLPKFVDIEENVFVSLFINSENCSSQKFKIFYQFSILDHLGNKHNTMGITILIF